MRKETVNRLLESKLIVIIRGMPPDVLDDLTLALINGGTTALEITFDQRQPATWRDTADAIRRLHDKYGDKLLVGAGTVLSVQELELAFDGGAQYIVSPNVNLDVIRLTQKFGLASLPGAMTPSEIIAAHQAGADIIKVFPASNLGEAYFKALSSPIPHIPLFAVGGIDTNNAHSFLNSGAVGVGVGGSLVNKEWIARREFDKITELTKAFIKTLHGNQEGK